MIKLLRLSPTPAITLLALSSNKTMHWDDPTQWHTIPSLSSRRSETTKFTIRNYWPSFTRSATFDYEIIPKPGKINKADALSLRPDYKEGIAFDNAERILLTPDKF